MKELGIFERAKLCGLKGEKYRIRPYQDYIPVVRMNAQAEKIVAMFTACAEKGNPFGCRCDRCAGAGGCLQFYNSLWTSDEQLRKNVSLKKIDSKLRYLSRKEI